MPDRERFANFAPEGIAVSHAEVAEGGPPVMTNAELPSFLRDLIAEDIIRIQDAAEYRANAQFFEEKRADIRHEYLTQWVAALNKRLYHQPSYRELEAELQDQRDFRYAYIEQVM